jgi:hypothetical protein
MTMNNMLNRLPIAVAIAAALAVLGGPAKDAAAADEAIAFGKETFKISLGYYRPNFNSRVAVGVSGGAPPGDISPEQDLGLDHNLGGARLDGYWRFADRHRIYFGYYQLNRSASKTLDHDIGPIDIPSLGIYETINAGSTLNLDAKWEIAILGYDYSFYKTEDLEFAGMIGVNVAQLGTKLSGTFKTSTYPGGVSGSTAGSTLTVPMPVIGLNGDWAIDDRWRMRAHAAAFKITINNIDAKVVDAAVAGEYRVWRNIWGGLGYTLLNASAAKNDGSSDASLDWRTGGPQLYVSMLF